MRIIKTRKNKEIIVDDNDFEMLSGFSWYVTKAYNKGALKYHKEFACLNKI
jgi:hypothetical protein